MTETSIHVIEYRTGEGRLPFREWLSELRDKRAAARVQSRLDRLSIGNFGDVRPVGKGVSELRVPYGPGYAFTLLVWTRL